MGALWYSHTTRVGWMRHILPLHLASQPMRQSNRWSQHSIAGSVLTKCMATITKNFLALQYFGDSYSKNLFLLQIHLSGNIINWYEKFMFGPWSVLFYSLTDLSFVRKHTLKTQILATYTHFKSVLPLLWLTKC